MTRVIAAKASDGAGGTTTGGSEAAPETKLQLAFLNTAQEASTDYLVWLGIKAGTNGATSDCGIRARNSTAGTTFNSSKVEQKDASDTRVEMFLGTYTSAATPVTQNFDL